MNGKKWSEYIGSGLVGLDNEVICEGLKDVVITYSVPPFHI